MPQSNDLPPIARQACRIDHDTREMPEGEPELGEIIWKGRQWAVTENGLETLDGSYGIDAGALLGDREDVYSWARHVGTKTWVDVDDFLTAWLIALPLFGHHVDPGMLRRTIADAPIQSWNAGRRERRVRNE